MSDWIRYVTISGLAAGLATPALSATYLSAQQAQEAIFPGRTLNPVDLTLTTEQRKAIEKLSGVRVRALKIRAWRVSTGGWLIIDEVVGKHEFITFAVGLNPDGSVKQVEVMDYRETYGHEIRNEKWRAQFVGKTHKDKLELDSDIRNISGATLSCRHVTDGVKRLLATYELVLKE